MDLICRESDECNHAIESFPYTEMHVLESVEDMDKPFNEVKPLAEGIFHKLSWKGVSGPIRMICHVCLCSDI